MPTRPLLRLAFSGGGGSRWSPMAGCFIDLAPVVVDMIKASMPG